MKHAIAIAAFALIGINAAYAQPAPSEKTSAQVMEELVSYKAQNPQPFGEADTPAEFPVYNGPTAIQVQTELNRAKAAGAVPFGELEYPSDSI